MNIIPKCDALPWVISAELQVSDALILADLVDNQARQSEANQAPGHARLCREFAAGIRAAHEAMKSEPTGLDQLAETDPMELNGREAR